MRANFVLGAGLWLLFAARGSAADLRLTDDDPLQLPQVGSYQLRVLAPRVLELTVVTGEASVAGLGQWSKFVQGDGQCALPSVRAFQVRAGTNLVPVTRVGFRRRVLYAPFEQRDLRIGNYLYLVLGSNLEGNKAVEVKNLDGSLWPATLQFLAKAAPERWSPVLHVNQTGYLPGFPKKAEVGYFLGDLGELELAVTNFQILDARSGEAVFRGLLRPRPDRGFPYPCYEHVLEADFTALQTPGEFQLSVPGLGRSFPFLIDEAVAGAIARSYALGLYHQRCGTSNALPFTRFTHAACHTAPAAIPDLSARFKFVNECLAQMTSDFRETPNYRAPQLANVAACLYPFVNHGTVDVSGGHHDAGDYSKYTINSASLIHNLVFSADVFPGAAALDNLGLPESGDGKSDLLEEAKWEADFLVKMQDADGGFYFLVYPREREYEIDVLPERGDPQVVFPKNTSATAAAVAALAQCAASPAFRKDFPEAASEYLQRAKRGWDFLQRAIARYGLDGSYQKITHYGNDFGHNDELAWAACELFLATGEQAYQQKLAEWLHPNDPATRLWGWGRLYASYGNATRDYAFAVKTGKRKAAELHPLLLEQCQAEVAAAGLDQLERATACAYGTSFPLESKRIGAAGWYFSSEAAFDLAVACQLDYPSLRDPRPKMLEALLSNLNYEQGANPVNVTYLTGLGCRRQRDIVDQYAENDRRVLPPTGIPLGNIQAGFGWIDRYGKELGALSYPSDGTEERCYPLYDRWGDSFNLSQEFVSVYQARALGCFAWLMAKTQLAAQTWRAAPGNIIGLPATVRAGMKLSLGLAAPALDLSRARIVWEAKDNQPKFGQTFSLSPASAGPHWVEAEAQLPDGRRVFGVAEFNVR